MHQQPLLISNWMLATQACLTVSQPQSIHVPCSSIHARKQNLQLDSVTFLQVLQFMLLLVVRWWEAYAAMLLVGFLVVMLLMQLRRQVFLKGQC